MFGNAHIYVVGGGAIGMALAASLGIDGRKVTVVRTSGSTFEAGSVTVAVEYGPAKWVSVPVEMVPLSHLGDIGHGIFAVTAKATANGVIAAELRKRNAHDPIVIMQNGLGVEAPFINSGFDDVYRCILYATSQEEGKGRYRFRSVSASPIGVVNGKRQSLDDIMQLLNTPKFPFRTEERIDGEAWRKTIMNAVFNSVCPLLDVDNGIFIRDHRMAAIAVEMIREILKVTERLGFDFQEDELLEQLLLISRRSDGQLISTLQDLKKGNETEIEFLNLEIARIAESLSPAVRVDRTKLLGELVSTKSGAQPYEITGVAG